MQCVVDGSDLPQTPPLSGIRRRGTGMRFPTPLRRFGAALLHQQMWLLGQDIRRPEGNALHEYGFICHRHPEAEQGSHMYTLPLGEGRRIVAWGFGLCYQESDTFGIFLLRQQFRVRIVVPRELPPLIWMPNQILPGYAPRTRPVWGATRAPLRSLLGWVRDYEEWIGAHCGYRYRQQCLQAWPKAITRAEDLVASWDTLMLDADATIGAFATPRPRDPMAADALPFPGRRD